MVGRLETLVMGVLCLLTGIEGAVGIGPILPYISACAARARASLYGLLLSTASRYGTVERPGDYRRETGGRGLALRLHVLGAINRSCVISYVHLSRGHP